MAITMNQRILSPYINTKWWFPEIGVPLNHPSLDGLFHEINHPAMGLLPWPWKPQGFFPPCDSSVDFPGGATPEAPGWHPSAASAEGGGGSCPSALRWARGPRLRCHRAIGSKGGFHGVPPNRLQRKNPIQVGNTMLY